MIFLKTLNELPKDREDVRRKMRQTQTIKQWALPNILTIILCLKGLNALIKREVDNVRFFFKIQKYMFRTNTL